MSAKYNSVRAAVEVLENRVLLASAAVVKDIFPGSDSSGAAPLLEFGGKLLFSASDDQHGEELWISDGTAGGTKLVKDINPGPNRSAPSSLVKGNGVVYFLADGGTGTEIWKTDGTSGGTSAVTAFSTSDDTGSAFGLAYGNGKLIFVESGTKKDSIWASNGSGPGASQRLKTLTSSGVTFRGATATGVFFQNNGQVWKSDGTAAGTVPITSLPGNAQPGFSTNNIFNNQLYFSAFVSGGYQLFHTVGNASATAGFGPLFQSAPGNFAVVGAKLYFTASDAAHGNQIWVTDGTKVTQVTTLNTSPDTLRDLTNANGTLYFTASLAGGVRQLFKLANGAPTPIPAPQDGSGTGPGFLCNVGSTVIFAGLDANFKSSLYQTDGTSISKVTGDPGLTPFNLLAADGTVFYSADDDAKGRELHKVVVTAKPPSTKLTVSITASQTTIDKNQKIKFTAHLTGGADVDTFDWDFGDGASKNGSATETHKYTQTSPKNGAFTVKLTVSTPTNAKATARITVIVKESIKIAITVPPVIATFIPFPLAGVVQHPENFKNLTVDIDWGDNTVQKGIKPGADGRFGGLHFFSADGIKTITVTAHDSAKHTGHKDATIFIAETAVPDPKNVADKSLGIVNFMFGGTKGNDKIEVKKDATRSTNAVEALEFFLDGALKKVYFFSLTKIQALVGAGTEADPFTQPPKIFTGGGNDSVKIGSGIRTSFIVDGGAGKDTIATGAGDDTISGGADNDVIKGGKGKNKVTQ